MIPARMYGEFASWWPLLSPPSDYQEEAGVYERALLDACRRPCRTLLELGSGGGSNASYLKARFEMVLVDLSPGMLEVSRGLNPDCEHVLGDMRTIRLDRRFDAVFVHDAVMYMTSEADLRQVMATAAAHCAPGGAALFAPDFVRETFRPSTDHGGSDGDGRGLRFLEWTWDPDPDDMTYVADYVYAFRDRDGSVRVEHDRHVEGLFARADWLRWLAAAGFDARVVPLSLTELGSDSAYEVFAATRIG